MTCYRFFDKDKKLLHDPKADAHFKGAFQCSNFLFNNTTLNFTVSYTNPPISVAEASNRLAIPNLIYVSPPMIQPEKKKRIIDNLSPMERFNRVCWSFFL
jgi:hypothetical protein